MRLPQTTGTLVLRTDFSADAIWEAVCDEIRRSSCEGYVEQYTCLSDPAWQDVAEERLLEYAPPPYFCLVVDRLTIEHAEHPVLAVDVTGKRTFRLVPSEATGFACNMNIANMDFEEFADNTDADGIFRGFH